MECTKKHEKRYLNYILLILFFFIGFFLLCILCKPLITDLAQQMTLSSSVDNLVSFLIAFMAIIFLLICVVVYLIILAKIENHEKQTLEKAIRTAKIIIISFLEDGVILDFNRIAEETLKYNAEDVIKTLNIFDFLSRKDQQKLKQILQESKTGKIENTFELCIRTKNNESKYVVFNLNVVSQKNSIFIYELMGVDISERVNSEIELFSKHEELSAVYEELAASEEELKDQLDELIRQKILLQEKDERYNLVVEASNLGIWEWDGESNSYFYSDKWYKIYEIAKEESNGEEVNWLDLVFPEDRQMVRDTFDNHINNRTPSFECEYRIRTKNGNVKWISTVGKALWDSDGKLIKMAGANSDITARKEIEEKVNKLAYFDTLTGLPNNTGLIRYFDSVKDKIKNMALIYVDLDNLKLINDSYGHVIGDKLLIEVSRRLTAMCTDKMHIARLNGDEFAVLVPDVESDEFLVEFVEKLINQIEVILKIDNYNNISLTANIGVAVYPRDARNIDELLKNADTAMYRAVESKCKYLFFEKKMNETIIERLNLRNSLKVALENNEFLLYYQPQIKASDKSIVGFEALLRWKNDNLGMVPPAKFIPIAEESKIIIPLGDWILEEAVKFIKKIHESGYPDLIISVNISVVQLIQSNFAEKVLKIADEYDVPYNSLELEITETDMMESMDLAINNIITLRQKGVRIALDDFGTGYSSLNYLTNLPLDTLKIDKSFIDNIGGESEKSLLTGSIVEIGRKLGLSIVAEGVETEDQYRYLAKRHCERIQGFFFSRPLPENEALRLMAVKVN